MPAGGPKEQLHKLLMIGESGSGKTCLIRQYVHKVFQPTSKPTIGVDFALKVIPPNNTTLQIWDIAGQERYGQMTRVYFQAAVGAMVVCDIQKPETYEASVKWKQDLDSKVFLPGTTTSIPCMLLLNKCDLGKSHFSNEQLDLFCQKHGFIGWMEVSAKEGTNVNSAFDKLVDAVQASGAGAQQVKEKPKPSGPQRAVVPGQQTPKPDGQKKPCPC